MKYPITIVVLTAMIASGAKPIRLFDGHTFDGWEGDRSVFRIQDKAIVGGNLKQAIKQNEFLCTTREYANFDLRLKFKLIGEGGNAGVQFRSRRIPNNSELIGYQADIGDGYWGSLYDESRRNKVLAKADDKVVAQVLKRDGWNDYRLNCKGRRIQLWLNGKLTVDYTEQDETIEQTGIIGLQIHGGKPSEAWYKDIILKPLS
jgi:hypothetical protein